MNKFPKFIIEDDCLIMMKVTFHKEIVINKEKVKGGGWFKFDDKTNTFIFYGESIDFGQASIENIKNCVEKGNVFTDNLKYRNISSKYNFSYDTGSDIVNLKTNN